METGSLLGFALAVGVVAGAIAYAGARMSEARERRRNASRRERKVQGMSPYN